jgi:uncharacterized membrane protein
MKKNLPWLLLSAILAIPIYFYIIHKIPALVMMIITQKLQENAVDGVVYGNLPKAGQDKIVKTSPDIVYATATYDLTQNPVRFRFQYPTNGRYCSVSLYEATTTDNVFVMNDREAKQLFEDGRVTIVFKTKNQVYKAQKNEKVVVLDEPKGVLLNRMIITNRHNRAEKDSVIAMQKQTKREIITN